MWRRYGRTVPSKKPRAKPPALSFVRKSSPMPTEAQVLSHVMDRTREWTRFHLSALKGQGLAHVFRSVDAAYKAATADLSTPQWTRALIDAVARDCELASHVGTRHPPARLWPIRRSAIPLLPVVLVPESCQPGLPRLVRA